MNKRRHKNIMRARMYLARRDVKEMLRFVDDFIPKPVKDSFDRVVEDLIANIGWADDIRENTSQYNPMDLFKPNKVTLNKN